MAKPTKDALHSLKVQIMWLWISLALVVLSSAFFIAALVQHDEYMGRFLTHQNYDSLYQQSARDYCYNNDIKPCTTDSIVEWMKAHPDAEKFVFKMQGAASFEDVIPQLQLGY